MNTTTVVLAVGAGVVFGLVAAAMLYPSDATSTRILRAAIRDKTSDNLPSWLVGVGDVVGAWDIAIGLADKTGAY